MAKPLGAMKNLPIGKAVNANITKGLTTGARLVCADNTGAKEVEIIAVRGYKGIRNRMPKAGVGDLLIVTVKKGRPEVMHQKLLAVVIRQRMPYRRYDGSRIKFEDNAAVIVTEDGLPKGTEIKGAVAREAADKWNKIGSLSGIVV
jgi:large subunit ribosomal protein L14